MYCSPRQSQGLPTSARDLQTNGSSANSAEEARSLLRPDFLKLWSKHWLFRSLLYGSCATLVVVLFCAGWLSSRMSEIGMIATNANEDQMIRFGSFHSLGHSSPITESVLRDAGGKGKHGYLAVVSNAAVNFHIKGSCSAPARTSVIAKKNGCRHAVNGGPFSSYWSGGCIGPMIQHGQVVNQDWNTSYAAFGIGSDGRWVMGHLSKQTYQKLGVVEALTGFGWLVRDGQPVAPAGDALAERTAIGVNANGDLILLQVDGCERCPFSGGPSGVTLAQFSKLLIANDAVNAINLDGGGSSTTVVDGVVKNRPDCLEIGLSCERPVTSVVCIT